jgi:hypothetical protein
MTSSFISDKAHAGTSGQHPLPPDPAGINSPRAVSRY